MSNLPKILMSALAALIFVISTSAQPRRDSIPTDKIKPLTSKEASERWEAFSTFRIASGCMGFSISHNPKKSESIFYNGFVYTSIQGSSNIIRIRIKKTDDINKNFTDFILKIPTESSEAWELKNGEWKKVNPNKPRIESFEVWKSINGKWVKIPEKEWFDPMIEGLVYSPFDLLMPYRAWGVEYESAGRIGQAVYFYSLKPPPYFRSIVSKVTIAITRDFNSLAQTEVFGLDGKVAKTISIGSIKKVDGEWIIKDISAHDELSRDKDVLTFRSAALRIALPASIFSTDAAPTAPETPELKAL